VATVPFERMLTMPSVIAKHVTRPKPCGSHCANALGPAGLCSHPQKTQIVHCKHRNRKGIYPAVKFDFLGYSFRPRLAAWRGGRYGVSFLPVAADTAPQEVAQGGPVPGGLQTRTDKALDDLARMLNSHTRG
jgi:RNA-directed DNA polymerase